MITVLRVRKVKSLFLKLWWSFRRCSGIAQYDFSIHNLSAILFMFSMQYAKRLYDLSRAQFQIRTLDKMNFVAEKRYSTPSTDWNRKGRLYKLNFGHCLFGYSYFMCKHHPH